MQIPENSRRNFISNIAFLSAGIMIKPTINVLPSITGRGRSPEKLGIVLEKIRRAKNE